tara:strand:+ start:30 stop:821 length:792 start_codon:yes stop_codon:yes gene_type:complete
MIYKIKQYINKNLFKHLKYEFEEYIPNSAGSASLNNKIIKINIKQLTNNLLNISTWFHEVEVLNLSNLSLDKNLENKVKELFDRHGSDKSKHGYHILYSNIFSNLCLNPQILEIGIGSVNKKIPSNMGKGGIPGASLLAFSEYFPGSKIYGADIDPEISINHQNITTFYLDQNNLCSFDHEVIKDKKFDLIIDDGLHMQSANLNTVRFSLDRLNNSGILIIEDIPESALNIWKILYNILEKPFNLELIKCKDNYAVIIKKLEN